MRGPLQLRPETDEDGEFLFALYASTRDEVLRGLPWTPEQRNQFTRNQFRAQTLHYRARYPDAAFNLILRGETPIGRLYLWRDPDQIRIVDISLLPAFRGQGIGSMLLAGVLADADNVGALVTMHVERNYRALRLYRRLGFSIAADQGVYLLLRREPHSLLAHDAVDAAELEISIHSRAALRNCRVTCLPPRGSICQ